MYKKSEHSDVYSCLITLTRVTFSSHSLGDISHYPFSSLSYNPRKDFLKNSASIPSLQTQPTLHSARLNSLFCPTSTQFSTPCIPAHPTLYPININCIPICTAAHSCSYSITTNLFPTCTTTHFSLYLTTFDASPACISQPQPSPAQPGATPG